MKEELKSENRELSKNDLIEFIESEFSSNGSKHELLEAMAEYADEQESLFDEASEIDNISGVSVSMSTDKIKEMLIDFEAQQIGVITTYDEQNEVYYTEKYNALLFLATYYGVVFGVTSTDELEELWEMSDLED